jgi:hypothetical protein
VTAAAVPVARACSGWPATFQPELPPGIVRLTVTSTGPAGAAAGALVGVGVVSRVPAVASVEVPDQVPGAGVAA